MPTAKPTAIELLQAVSQFIQQDIAPQLQGASAFNAKIAINVLAIIERELRQGETLDIAETNRLHRLLGVAGDAKDTPVNNLEKTDNLNTTRETLNATLIESIRTGQHDLASQDMLEHLYKTTLGKLSIDNPRYASYKKVLAARADSDR